MEYVENNISTEEVLDVEELAVCCLFNDGNPQLILVSCDKTKIKIIYEIEDSVSERENVAAWRMDYLYLPELDLFDSCVGMLKPYAIEGDIVEAMYKEYVK